MSSYDASTEACANVLFVGVRGSDEHSGFGPTISAVASDFKTQLSALNPRLSGREVYVDYPAASVKIIGNDFWDLVFETLLNKPLTQPAYYDSINAGAYALSSVLKDSLNRCPNERWVLSGYSQGAAVAYLGAANFVNADRWVGGFLVGDPNNFPDNFSQSHKLGTAPRRARGNLDIIHGHSYLPSDLAAQTYTLCNGGDIVCDTSDDIGLTLRLSASLNPLVALAKLHAIEPRVAAAGIATHGFYADGRFSSTLSRDVRLLSAHVNAVTSTLVTAPTPTPTPTPAPTPSATPSPVATAAPIADPNLAACITKELKAEGYGDVPSPTTSDLAKLTELACDIFSSKPTDISQLAYGTNLISLGINAQFSDASPVANLTKLTYLRLNGDGTMSVAPIGRLTSLKTLYLSAGTLTNLGELDNLTQATYVGVGSDSGTLTDVSALEPLTHHANVEPGLQQAQRQGVVGTNYSHLSIIGFDGSRVQLTPADQATEDATTVNADGSFSFLKPGSYTFQFNESYKPAGSVGSYYTGTEVWTVAAAH